MAIIHFTFDRDKIPADATHVTERNERPGAGGHFWTYATHNGLCISEREMNGYHDSDFYMLVWDPEKGEPHEILFASTRGWTYPSYASAPDATPETLAAYEAWKARKAAERRASERKAKALILRANRKLALKAAREHGFPHWRLTKLRHGTGYEAVLKLLASKRVRSKFKLSLRAQAIAWLKEQAPKYATPFSAKQVACLHG